MNSNITFDIIRGATANPNSVALILENETITYQKLDNLVWRVAHFLKEHSVRVGDVVGVYCFFDINTILLMFGIARIGATVLSLPKSASPVQIQEMLTTTNAATIVCDSNLPISTKLTVLMFDPRSLSSTSLTKKTLIEPEPKHPWIIISGSGTTGKPKLIPIDHQTQRFRNEMSDESLCLTRHDIVASLSHFDFTHPKTKLLETLRVGGSFVVHKSNRSIIEMCNSYNLTVLHATVFHTQNILRSTQSKLPNIFPNLRIFGLSASTISQPLRHEIREKLTKKLLVRYASNETGPISFATSPEVFEITGTVGKPHKNVKVTILNKGCNSPPNCNEGMVVIKSPGNFSGYLGDTESTAQRFHESGFTPGDVVKLEPSGNIIFLGRSDDMMIFNGMNIYPSEIERVLSAHHAVEDSISFPFFHAVHQDVPVAAVATKLDMMVSEDELLNYCQSNLGSRRPHRIFILDSIPRNLRGKVIKHELFQKIKSKYK